MYRENTVCVTNGELHSNENEILAFAGKSMDWKTSW
jgi:hypothetical protein